MRRNDLDRSERRWRRRRVFGRPSAGRWSLPWVLAALTAVLLIGLLGGEELGNALTGWVAGLL